MIISVNKLRTCSHAKQHQTIKCSFIC